MVTHAVVTVISRKHSVAWLTVSSANVVWVFEAWVAWTILMAVLEANRCGCRSYAALTSCVASIGVHLRQHIFPLADLGAVFHAVCLLDEKHIAVVLRGFHNLWASSPILHIHPEALIGQWTLGAMRVISGHIWLVLGILILVFGTTWGTISRSKPSKPGIVHLLLQEVAWIGVMDVVLQSLNQSLLIGNILLILRRLYQVIYIIGLIDQPVWSLRIIIILRILSLWILH